MNYKFDADRPFIFISYSHADEDLVHADVERLSKYGVNLWYDANMSEGYSWEEYAKPKIMDEDCMAVLFYASYASLISKPCYEELRFSKETFDKFTSDELKKERDFNRHSLIKQKSKKIISVDLMNGSIPSVIEALLASAKTNTSIIESNIEFIKNYIFQDFKVLYSVYKDDGEHIEKLLMRSLRELPKDVVIFNSSKVPHVAPPVPAPAAPVPELVCYETASNTLQAIPADSPNLPQQQAASAARTFNHIITNTDATYGLMRFKKSTGIHEFLSPNMPVTLIYNDIKHKTKVHSIKAGRISSVPFVRNIPVGTVLSVAFDGVNTITLTDAAP